MPTSNFRITLVGFASLAIAMGVGRFAITPLLPQMQAEGTTNIAEGGVLAAVHFLGYLMGALLTAKLSLAPKVLLRRSLIVIAVSTLTMGLTESLVVWLLCRGFSGFCSASILVLVSTYYIRQLEDSAAGNKQGWVFSGVGGGIALVGVAVLVMMSWQIGAAASWLIIGVVTSGLCFFISLSIRSEISSEGGGNNKSPAARGQIYWWLVLAYGAAGFGYILPATYLPVMAQEIIDRPEIFGLSWPIFGCAALVSTPLAGRLRSHFSNRQIWSSSQIVMAIGLLVPALNPSIFTIIFSGICVGGTFMIITMVGLKEMHRLAPVGGVAHHIGVMTTAFAVGQILGPLIGGVVHSFSNSFAPILAAGGLALILTAGMLIFQPADQTRKTD